MATKSNQTVYILTYCKNLDLFYGTELIFKTLRIGYPNAKVNVIDNASIPEARERIKVKCTENKCNYIQLDESISHSHYLRNVLSKETGTVIFLDPDIILWENLENWDLNGLVCGRFIPEFFDSYTRCLTLPRLHTSFLYIPDAEALNNKLLKIQNDKFECNFFTPFMFKRNEEWIRLDTAASLYSALGDAAYKFEEKELEGYDHIFCGSHLDLVVGNLGNYANRMKEIHKLAQTDYFKLKGIYKEQNVFFNT